MAELVPTSRDGWRAAPAGDVFNVLVGAARLGLRCSFISAVGSDGFAEMIFDALDREKIDSACVVRDPVRQNGIYTVESDGEGERRFHYWRRGSAAAGMMRTLDADTLFETIGRHRFLLLSGVTLAIVEERELLLELARRVADRVTIVLDTNYRPKLWRSGEEYRFWWEQLVPYGAILLPSWEDIGVVYGADQVEPTLRRWGDGRALVVVKRGADGCGWIERDHLMTMPALVPEHIADTAGAGDAFNAGVLAALARDAAIDDACMLGQQQAARALAVRGAIEW